MKNKLYILLIALLATSCESFLTELPETAIPEEEAMLTLSDAEQVCLGVYSTFKNPALYSGSMIEAAEVQADLFYAAIGYTNQFGDFYRWEQNANDATLLSIYGGLYQIVNRCNFFFDHREAVENTLKSDVEKETMKKYVADVAFMRAYAYSDLVRFFCKAYDPATAATTPGVPLYTHYRVNGKTVEVLPRASLEECYKLILDDLKLAEELEPRKGGNAPFVTQGAVKALRARILLNMKKWKEAEDAATEVIDAKIDRSPLYKLADANRTVLAPNGTASSEFKMMWEYDSSDEIIWKINFSDTDHTGALGSFWMGINSGNYNPSYLPADWLMKAYPDYDLRYEVLFPITPTVRGIKWEVMHKFPGNPEIDGYAGPYYCNMPKLLRLAETYLIRAEARCMQENTNEACKDITTLRKARIRDYGSFLCEQAQLLKAIQTERALELVGEGFRLTDLKRWNLGFERKPQEGTIEGSKYSSLKVLPNAPRFTWLIPQHEITASNGLVEQN